MTPWTVAHTRRAELMDDPALPEAEHLHALRALATINLFSRTASQVGNAVAGMLAGRTAATPPLIVDVASGGGDVTIALARRLGRERSQRMAASRSRPNGPAVLVTGIDVSERAVARAAGVAARSGVAGVSFEVRDVLADGCPPCDVATSSLFLHHLDDADAGRVLRSLAAAARVGIVVSDLVRSAAGLALAVVGTTVLSRSRVARVDGPLSVRAARTPAEYERLFADCGLAGARVRRTWPERVLIEWKRPVGDGTGRMADLPAPPTGAA